MIEKYVHSLTVCCIMDDSESDCRLSWNRRIAELRIYFANGSATIPTHTSTNISCTQFTSSLVNFTIFCPPNGGDLGAENPGLVLVIILPLWRKKLGFDSYEKWIFSFGELVVDVGALGGGIVIVAVRHTDPYAAHASDKYATRADVFRNTTCVTIGSSCN